MYSAVYDQLRHGTVVFSRWCVHVRCWESSSARASSLSRAVGTAFWNAGVCWHLKWKGIIKMWSSKGYLHLWRIGGMIINCFWAFCSSAVCKVLLKKILLGYFIFSSTAQKLSLITGMQLFLNNLLPPKGYFGKFILIGRQGIYWQFRSALVTCFFFPCPHSPQQNKLF